MVKIISEKISSHKAPIVLLILILFGGVVRFWGINFGLPHTQCRPDEQIIVDIAFGFGKGDLNPHYFIYPTLYMYLLFFIYVVYFLVGLLRGTYTSASDLVAEFVQDPTNFFLMGRCLSALMGTATILVVYKIVKAWWNERVALLAAFFLSLAFLHVRDSHFGVTDVPTTFFIMCAVLAMSHCSEKKRIKDYLVAGFFAGLAASTKYVGVILLGPMLIVHYFNILDEYPRQWRRLLDKRIISFCVSLFGTFLVATPYALLDYRSFLAGFLYDVNHLQEGHWTIVLERGLLYHLKYTLPYGLGWPLFGASLVGIAVFMKTNLRKALILFSFPLLYYIPAGWGHSVFVRYMIPLIPFLCIAGAVGVATIADLCTRGLSLPFKKGVPAIAAVLIIAPSLYSVVQFNMLLARKDNRLIATEWIIATIPGGASIYQHVLPPLELPHFLADLEKEYQQKATQGIHSRGLKIRIENMRSRNLIGYKNWEHSLFGDKFYYNKVEQTTLPDYIILGLSPLRYHSIPHDDVQQALLESYTLKKAFIAVDMSITDRWYDLQDAFYLPFKGFRGVSRPGPNIYIYERKK